VDRPPTATVQPVETALSARWPYRAGVAGIDELCRSQHGPCRSTCVAAISTSFVNRLFHMAGPLPALLLHYQRLTSPYPSLSSLQRPPKIMFESSVSTKYIPVCRLSPQSRTEKRCSRRTSLASAHLAVTSFPCHAPLQRWRALFARSARYGCTSPALAAPLRRVQSGTLRRLSLGDYTGRTPELACALPRRHAPSASCPHPLSHRLPYSVCLFSMPPYGYNPPSVTAAPISTSLPSRSPPEPCRWSTETLRVRSQTLPPASI
jgi:hypothetical protein